MSILSLEYEDILLADAQAKVRQFTSAAIAENTKRAYYSDLRHFLRWGGRIPAPPELLASYLAEHAERLSVPTLVRRLTSIGKAHTSQAFPNPATSELVRLTMRGIRRTYGKPQRQVAALLVQDIQRVTGTFSEHLKDVRDRALILVGFAGAFRRSELIAIDCNDLEWTTYGLIIELRRSKTDQERQGRRVAIPYGRTAACPVLALEAWTRAAQITNGPVFRSVSRNARVGCRRLTGEAVAHIIKRRVAAVGLDPNRYSGHSLRAGLATSAAQAGVSIWKIKEQTGHRSDAMVARYIRDGNLFVQNAASAVL